jgi:uncharacterized protein YjaG (DUF416 family)
MKRALSVDTIKRNTTPHIPASPLTVTDVVLRPHSYAVTRRQALGLAGALGLAAAPIASAIESAMSTTFTVSRRGQRIAFLVAGVERWVIDPRHFSGNPSIEYHEDASGISLALRDAYFPGTSVPASFSAEIKRGTTPRIHLTLKLTGRIAEAAFVPWLLDRVDLATASKRSLDVNVGDASIMIPAGSEVSLRPKWAVQCRVSNTWCRVPGSRFLGDGSDTMAFGSLDQEPGVWNLELALPSNANSLLVPAAKKRTLARLHRGEAEWNVSLRMANTEAWSAYARPTTFDALNIEASDDARTAYMLEGRNGAYLSLNDIDARMELRDVRLAWAQNDHGLHEAFVARYADKPSWMVVGGISLEIGDREGIPPLEIERRNGELTRCIVAPGLLRYNIPVDGAITEPTRMNGRTQLALISPDVPSQALPKPHFYLASLQLDGQQLKLQGKVQQDATKGKFTIKQDPKLGLKSKFGLTLPNNPSITVIRPDDMLVLTFEFAGITINKAAGSFTAGGSGKLIVHFQPQHIAERAFFYVSDDEPNTAEAPASSGKNTGNEPRVEPPIESVMAHSSRLVFTVPNGHTGQYSIEGLLDWSKYVLRVSPSAKPPPVMFTLGKLNSSFANKFMGNEVLNPTPGQIFITKGSNKQRAKISKVQANQNLVSRVPASQKSSVQNKLEASSDLKQALPDSLVNEYLSLLDTNPPIKVPGDEETAIEYPYRLILSPNKYAGWAHSKTAKRTPESEGSTESRTELWHTRLGVKHSDGSVSENAAYFRTVRAIWSPDVGTDYSMDAKYKERPFRTSMNRRDRHEIVQLTSNYGMTTNDEPIDVNRLMLTSLGAWADMVGAWDPYSGTDPKTGDKIDVEQWIQRGTQGRDHFVRICYKGFLFPFGNRATLVKESERKFRRTPRGDMAAYLMQRMYIILRQPVREFHADGIKGMQYQGRGFPFRRVTITTKVTPNLKLPVKLEPSMSSNSFWPIYILNGNDADVQWSCIGRDWDNNDIQFSTPLAFIANGDVDGAGLETWIKNTYRKGETTRRRIAMSGQTIAFAPSAKQGDTSLPTTDFMLTGYFASGAQPGTVHFFPEMQDATTSIEKVNELLGTESPQKVKYFFPYLKYAFEKGNPAANISNLDALKNTSQIYLNLVNQMGMNFAAQSDKAGGLAAPSISIGALSRMMGPIPGDFNIADSIENEIDKVNAIKSKIENAVIAAGNFDPTQYFADLLNTKLLGDITLKDVLDFLQDVMNNLDSMPGLDKKDDFGVSDAISEAASKSDIVNSLTDKLNTNEAIKDAVNQVQQAAASEVKAAKQAVLDEIAAIKTEIEKAKQDIQNEVDGARKYLDNQLREWKKRLEDKVNELKSEVDKAIQPLKEAGNEAYKAYEQVNDALESLKQGLNLVYEWQTEILKKPFPGGILEPLYPSATSKSQRSILYLKAELKKKIDLAPPEVHLFGSVSNFIVNLIGKGAAQFIIIKINRIAISAKVGEKPSIDPDIEEVAFGGPLTFVNKLKDLIPSGGGGGGVGFSFGFDVLPSGITATLTITLPNVTVGVFALMNMSFIMSLTVPFDGRAFSAYFAFCTRENPFRISIMMFGGGGFFGIEITPKGVRMLEAAFEFGGNFAFDCGVASGGASVMAGIYYKLELIDDPDNPGETVEYSELTGYFRLTGNLSILGLIRVSLLFELKLTWQSNGKVFGVATIEVEIEILFISFSVGVTVERQLKGSDGDPTFADQLPQASMWQEYCNAFASS